MRRSAPAVALTLLALSTGAAHAQDLAAGGKTFQQKCMMCHTVTPGAKAITAPNLLGVSNRRAASTDFAYSPALKASKMVWTSATLDKFLTGPSQLVPGTRMTVTIPDPAQRANVVAYLMTLKR